MPNATIFKACLAATCASVLCATASGAREVVGVSTVAGCGQAGFADGPRADAAFNCPDGIAVDAHGNLYVADGKNHRLRKITPEGIVSTLAGSGSAGFADGPGASARFHSPHGVAVDASGNVYVADTDNNRIRKVNPSGLVTTLAGTGDYGDLDGDLAHALIAEPAGLALDARGTLYITEFRSGRIRKLTRSGRVSTLAGGDGGNYRDGRGSAARFNDPYGVAVDRAGNLYVADTFNFRIRKISPSGRVSTLAGDTTMMPAFVDQINQVQAGYAVGGFADGRGTRAKFGSPTGVAVDARGTVFVADADNNRIRQITPDGVVKTVAGSGEKSFRDGSPLLASFTEPIGIALDALGDLYITECSNQRVRKLTRHPH